jgi:quercetin dioxygenase-like cupin family protein
MSATAEAVAAHDQRKRINAFQLQELELIEGWGQSDPTQRARFDFPITAATGAASTTLVYFELEPGTKLIPHTHTAEEILLILEGTAEATIEDEKALLTAGGVALIPAMSLHNVVNAGSQTVRAVGFFSSAGMVNSYEDVVMPLGTRVIVTPIPQ